MRETARVRSTVNASSRNTKHVRQSQRAASKPKLTGSVKPRNRGSIWHSHGHLEENSPLHRSPPNLPQVFRDKLHLHHVCNLVLSRHASNNIETDRSVPRPSLKQPRYHLKKVDISEDARASQAANMPSTMTASIPLTWACGHRTDPRCQVQGHRGWGIAAIGKLHPKDQHDPERRHPRPKASRSYGEAVRET